MRDSRKRDAAVEDELIAFTAQQLFEHRSCSWLVPTVAEQGAAVGQRLVHARVARDDRIADEVDIRGDPDLQQEHEKVAEPGQPGTRVAQQSSPDLGGWLGKVGPR